MITMELDMVQYDCPYIDTTIDYDVSFYAKQWDFNPAAEVLETRIMVTGADRGALDNGLGALRKHENMYGYELLKREGNVATIRSRIGQTDAMGVIRERDGYITGPFEIDDGSETWHVGFDRSGTAESALAALSRNNEFSVQSRESIDLEEYSRVIENVDAASKLLSACRNLSTVERTTLLAAVENGYFETPRDATLSSLADEFGVSKMAISKNLRRGERKLLGDIVDAMQGLDELD